MRIAVDAMGGDYAPEVAVAGAVLAQPDCPADIVLIGPENEIRSILDTRNPPSRLQVCHAQDFIGMDEAGPVAIRKKKDASISVAMRLLAAGEVDAVVSAGNSAAIVAAARHYVGLVHGLRRPALAVVLPMPQGSVLLADVGAHAEAVTEHLVQSAALVHAYLKTVTGVESPRLGMLNIGKERVKGTESTRRAYSLLERSRLNFVGNLEPHELFTGQADAVVCDGFVGNIVLKLHECWVGVWRRLLAKQQPLPGSADTAQGDLNPGAGRLESRWNCQDIGGAPLLGARKTVVVAHGCSRESAIANAVHVAVTALETGSIERVVNYLDTTPILSELKLYSARWVLDHWKNRWGGHKKPS
ncbi:MAG TPA: phosphate acyltransferase PlsX [Syntrophobacteraceae bacterium]|jgi:phosphate acyltransferase|nr:phosphate acyltransferase PlsX [Syntrophobacteraceae bacterium]HBZ56367.1 phosphate acyltransferase PlsX [Syntrophobacteraceae bacterium]